MKKSIILFATFITLIFLFTACSNQSGSYNYPIVDNTTNDIQASEENNELGVSLSSCSEGLYIKKADLFYAVNSQVYYTVENGAKKYSNIMGVGMLKTDSIPIITLEENELTIFSDAEDIQYRAIPVTEYGYCSQGIINQTGHMFDEDYQIFYKIKSNSKGFDSLNDTDIGSLEELSEFAYENDIILYQEPASTKKYSFLFSSEKKSFDAVYYEGTNAVKYSLNVDVPAVLIDREKAISLETVKTDDGYFCIDLTSLNTGKYVIVLRYGAVPFDHCYLIEVK